MADEKEQESRGFGERVRGLAGEYAHEQGWGLNEAERTREPDDPQDTDGGTNYEYGAQDFGDTPVNADILDRTPLQAPLTPDLDRKPDPQQNVPVKNQGDPLDGAV